MQKQTKNKINLNDFIKNYTNNLNFYILGSGNPDSSFNKIKDIRLESKNYNNNYNNKSKKNDPYLQTEPEKKDNISSSKIKNFPFKKALKTIDSNLKNSFNSINTNYVKTYQNQSYAGVSNTPMKSNNINQNDNSLKLQLKRSRETSSSLSKHSCSKNITNNSNINNSCSKQKSNSKTKKINILPIDNNNSNKKVNGGFISKKNIKIPSEVYSSHNDFIEDFFYELQNYINFGLSEDSDKLISNKNNVLNIFDNIFKNIITGQKPMESLDIDIKKKLSKYSETWKNFLHNFERNSIKLNMKRNPSYVNNINLSTKNVINHNHNINTEPCGNNNFNANENIICNKNCYNKLEKDLEEKFTKLMKKEVGKIKIILDEKEKLIENLQNQINIKNTYISEIQHLSSNNGKSNDLVISNRLIKPENFLEEKQDKTSENNILQNISETQFVKNNLEQNFNHINQNTNNKIKKIQNSNKDQQLKKILDERDRIEKVIEQKKLSETIDEQTELLLYDRKQFIRERRLLISENKSLFDKVNELEKAINIQKEKEIKLMKLLFFLKKQGIPIDEIIQNHVLTDKSCREDQKSIMCDSSHTHNQSFKSLDSIMFYPITIDKPTPYVKPNVIPILDFTDINDKYNMEYESGKKSVNYVDSFKNNKNCANTNLTVNESSSSFIEFNKIKNNDNFDYSIINNISKLDHMNNRGIDMNNNSNKNTNNVKNTEKESYNADVNEALKKKNILSKLNLKKENESIVNFSSNNNNNIIEISNNLR